MATGILGTPADLAAATNTTIYTVPAETFAVLSVNICNRSIQSRSIRIAISSSDSPTNAEFIDFDVDLVGNGTMERSGLVLDAGKKIVVYADSTDISAMAYGIETPTA